MQNIGEENQRRAIKAQQSRSYGVRVFAGLLGIQGGVGLITTTINFASNYSLNPSLVLSMDFLSLNASIFVLLLAWGLWAFKRWAYWVTLLVEVLILIRAIFILVLHPGPLEIGSGDMLSLVFILYLVASPGARATFLQKTKSPLSENEQREINPHVFE